MKKNKGPLYGNPKTIFKKIVLLTAVVVSIEWMATILHHNDKFVSDILII